ncbi:MAG: hypothetical protein ACOX0R_01925 [Candidatus Dojkabacteria bacterium]|jgi:uncharacterized coiled-coil DUF342 family protein
MKNVDVPMWDKGDSTDNFAKGGGRSSLKFDDIVKEDKKIIGLFKLILGRKPSTRESAYYRISRASKENITEKLINSEEHKELIVSAQKYPEVLKEKKQLESTVLKLKSNIEDSGKEFEELKKLLEEKNRTIRDLREEKDKPYLTKKELIEESNIYYSKFSERTPTKKSYNVNDQSLWDRILKLFFK